MKTTKNLNQDSRSPGRDSNSGPPEYEAGMLTTQPRSSLINCPTNYLAYKGIWSNLVNYNLKMKIINSSETSVTSSSTTAQNPTLKTNRSVGRGKGRNQWLTYPSDFVVTCVMPTLYRL
jgi:hypothetical protein